jgi:hypothetical protein
MIGAGLGGHAVGLGGRAAGGTIRSGAGIAGAMAGIMGATKGIMGAMVGVTGTVVGAAADLGLGVAVGALVEPALKAAPGSPISISESMISIAVAAFDPSWAIGGRG